MFNTTLLTLFQVLNILHAKHLVVRHIGDRLLPLLLTPCSERINKKKITLHTAIHQNTVTNLIFYIMLVLKPHVINIFFSANIR